MTPPHFPHPTIPGLYLPPLDHPYNVTADNERAVEVPIALDFLERHPGTTVELGNVLQHYHDPAGQYVVVDHLEGGPRVLQRDVRDWAPAWAPDTVVSISTVEHVGWDQPDPDPATALVTVARLAAWNPVGALMVSFPIGHHPDLDHAMATNHPVFRVFDSTALYTRSGDAPPWDWYLVHHWDTLNPEERLAMLADHPYDRATPSARAVWMGLRG